MRLFFALLPDATALNKLCQVAAVVGQGASLRRVPSENLHVTLAFIGDIDGATLSSVRDAAAAANVPCGAVSFSRCEYWPKSRVVVAAGGAVAPEIAELATQLQSPEVTHRAKAIRESVWLPHVTLARNVSQPPVLQAISPIEWIASSFALMSSERRDGRSVYTVVDTYPLLDKI
jgi:RNA 2',3'-cyclic 3'-phosphodiesterase